jgi:hypothetical protein
MFGEVYLKLSPGHIYYRIIRPSAINSLNQASLALCSHTSLWREARDLLAWFFSIGRKIGPPVRFAFLPLMEYGIS